MEFGKKEIGYLILASIIAGFVFSFDEWGAEKFDLSIGLLNLLKAIIICFIIYTVHIFAQKLVAKRANCEVEFITISSSFKKIPIYLRQIGPILTLLFSIISNGKLFFIALASFNILSKRKYRVGHKWTNVKEFEEAKIAFAGPLSNLILSAIFKLLLPLSPIFFSKATFIASTLTIFHLLPFPKFDGIRIFMGSRFLYLFAVVLAILSIVLINFINVVIAVFLALLISIIITFYFFF